MQCFSDVAPQAADVPAVQLTNPAADRVNARLVHALAGLRRQQQPPPAQRQQQAAAAAAAAEPPTRAGPLGTRTCRRRCSASTAAATVRLAHVPCFLDAQSSVAPARFQMLRVLGRHFQIRPRFQNGRSALWRGCLPTAQLHQAVPCAAVATANVLTSSGSPRTRARLCTAGIPHSASPAARRRGAAVSRSLNAMPQGRPAVTTPQGGPAAAESAEQAVVSMLQRVASRK